MEYHLLAQPLKADPAGIQFLHGIEFKIKPIRYKELEEFLTERCGAKHETWRTQARFLNNSWSTDPVRGSKHPESIVVRFVDKAQALLFKMSWDSCVVPPPASIPGWNPASVGQVNKVILPIIRRVMPSVIAQEIIGVQPMTGDVWPADQALKVRYDYDYESDRLPRELSAEEIAEDARRVAEALARQQMSQTIQEWDAVTKGVQIEPMVTKDYVDTLSHKQHTMASVLENTRRELERLTAEESARNSPVAVPSTATSADTSGNDQ